MDVATHGRRLGIGLSVFVITGIVTAIIIFIQRNYATEAMWAMIIIGCLSFAYLIGLLADEP